ncbi:UDP-N-acetylmuramoyl-L-alanyl-D-glutamate--2,6-diaminopimelate ligase [Enterobacteriaceae endosymbiont of Macroplea appendiculata]|uniref:UDP-N-acetylmuramoyl-L-alanyl-D-glutamate--2, 6-diaminopimelate ligase n=1 Tax=Enterobacteriaceae endosymbiont of Macroplea appendiculata TaxID=2675790 RepID=UPI0014493817|nr:UDP-N-acetylmuramoyl-L-alanyl-D-glutamate--2,6-diaminopimelate ligase [Enterobacteriaceae endosymbiont of Macroplea appendiculata]QJC30763.1 UDP-N-acetylmuramoyl-L-alanyl-D-glutamate--2,6-diaminopimelate ligase [Enterobacteriaceae endosymbiont of Macroplea appendiculata]
MNLNHLLSDFINIKEQNIFIKNMCMNSKKILNNCLFIALKGHVIDGQNYINDAIINGAVAVLTYNTDRYNNYITYINLIPIIHIKNLQYHLSSIASKLYQCQKTTNIPIIGVTGTNGKTSVTNILMQWLCLLKQNPTICSTIGNGFYNSLNYTNNTTDSAIDIQYNINKFIQQKSNIIILEISSHGIKQHRVRNINFTTAIFTNLSRDHLDYHKNMQDYANTKWYFITQYGIKDVIINIDSDIGLQWSKQLPNAILVTTKPNLLNKQKKYFLVKDINYKIDKTIITFETTWGSGKISTHLLGYFNVINIILSFTTLLSLNYSLKDLLYTSYKLKPVYGRFNIIQKNNHPKIIIDYAHTPDALKNILQTIKFYYKSTIWCIFGCGGERDQGKRSLMGIIASSLANYIIITSDNPRNENINDIVQDIIKKCSFKKKHISIIIDRKEAIQYALIKAQKQDVILIAGKGHEQYQIIGHKYYVYSDYDIVNNYYKQK